MSGRSSVVLANSFRVVEVRALLELHERVLRGDVEGALAAARRDDTLALVRKFVAMRAKHDDAVKEPSR